LKSAIRLKSSLNGIAFFPNFYEDIIPASHMESDCVMDAIQLKNWVFVARKHKVGHPPLKTTDLLKLAPGINYQINGTLFSQADQSRNTTVWTAEGLCYALNEISADIISEVSANALSADQLISVLKESYVIDDSAVLTDILKDLISKRILDFN
jgi:hypothetical protein